MHQWRNLKWKALRKVDFVQPKAMVYAASQSMSSLYSVNIVKVSKPVFLTFF